MSARPSLPGLEANVEDILRRVGILEAAAPAAGGGIQFDTFPQAGDWLYVETDDSSGSPHGLGLQLSDFSTGGMLFSSSARILIDSDDQLLLEGDSVINLASLGIVDVNAAEFDVGVTSSMLTTVDLRAHTGSDFSQILMAQDGNNPSFSSIHLSGGSTYLGLSDTTATGQFIVFQAGPINDCFAVLYSGAIRMPQLPTVDPALGDGQIWNNGGVLTMST